MTEIRTMLFVPGDRPDRIPKALATSADCVVLDLEDAVADSAKEAARATVVNALKYRNGGSRLTAVRVNGPDTKWLEGDLRALATIWDRVDLIVQPMVTDAASVIRTAGLMESNDAATDSRARPRLLPLLETAKAINAATEIASAHSKVALLAFGPADLSRQLRVTLTPGGTELLAARSALVLASAAAGLPAPIDGPWLQLNDEAGLRESASHAKAIGFGGKQVVHPRQLPTVEEVFATTTEQIEWARSVDEAFAEAESRGVASISLPNGDFVDYAIALRARQILDAAAASPSTTNPPAASTTGAQR